MVKLGMCIKGENAYIVCWFEGDRITIPALGTLIATDTHDRQEALAICKRNLVNFIET